MKLRSGLLFIGICLTSFTTAEAASLLRQEPAKGKLPAGETVLVDNGRCARGKILAVTGGSNRSLHSAHEMAGSQRSYKCVLRPAG